MTDRLKTLTALRARRWTQAAALSVAAVLIAGCGEKPPAKPNQQSEAPRDPMQVSADAELASRLSLGPVATRPVTETIRVAGRLDVNQYRTSRIGAPITGRLTRVEAVRHA